MIDVILDTDAFNEVDDQFALAYMMLNKELNPIAIYAAPFLNSKVKSAEIGMEKSFDEIFKILALSGRKDFTAVYRGSNTFLENENTPVISPAAEDLVKRAKNYDKHNKLTVVAIGAITNIASAIILDNSITERIKIVWLGGHGREYRDTKEFNMCEDIAAARVVMSSDAEFVQLPCKCVVSEFTISEPELNYWLTGKNELTDYLSKIVIEYSKPKGAPYPWTKVIWDVTAVAYLLNKEEKFMLCKKTKRILPDYNGYYEKKELDKEMTYVYKINRDVLMNDLITTLLNI
ncbi:MAG: nucleoside hydrolase [Clostridia bacterium]|nr:nucleoside hydrolase [Clostridia bacterium]